MQMGLEHKPLATRSNGPKHYTKERSAVYRISSFVFFALSATF